MLTPSYKSYKAGPGNSQALVTRFQEFEPAERPESADGVGYFRKIQSVDRQ